MLLSSDLMLFFADLTMLSSIVKATVLLATVINLLSSGAINSLTN